MLRLRRNHKVINSLVVALAVVCTISLAAFFGFKNHAPEFRPTASITDSKKTLKLPEKIDSKVMFTGNSFWGRYIRDAANKTDTPEKFPFERLNEFKRDSYDAWVTGLECPTTTKGVGMSSEAMEATLTFNCDPSYLPEFAKWFDVAMLANNHIDNMGADGFVETREALDKNQIQYFGHYDPDVIEDACEVISLPVRVTYDDKSVQKVDLPIAMCGYHGVFKIPSKEAVNQISKYAEYFPVIAMTHSGAEYVAKSDQIKQTSYRSMIDAGADMVLGDHPHWIQETEDYEGKLIVYSMGNFMFDQQADAEVTRSAAIVVDMDISGQDSTNLANWIKLGDACRKFKDDCLDKAKSSGLKKIQPTYKFSFIATSDKGYQTHPAPELTTAIEQRLNWNATMRSLGQED